MILREKCHVKWLKDGDRNSAFFHHVMRYRIINKPLHSIFSDGRVVIDSNLIWEYVINYFQQIFSANANEAINLNLTSFLMKTMPPFE